MKDDKGELNISYNSFKRLLLESSTHEITIPSIPLQDDNILTPKTAIIRTCEPKSNISNPNVVECSRLDPSNQDTSEVPNTFHSPPTSIKDD